MVNINCICSYTSYYVLPKISNAYVSLYLLMKCYFICISVYTYLLPNHRIYKKEIMTHNFPSSQSPLINFWNTHKFQTFLLVNAWMERQLTVLWFLSTTANFVPVEDGRLCFAIDITCMKKPFGSKWVA